MNFLGSGGIYTLIVVLVVIAAGMYYFAKKIK